MITAILLAAGQSKRMGTPKQLLPWGSHTIIEEVVGNLLGSELIDELRVIVGARAAEVRQALKGIEDERLYTIYNRAYRGEMILSIEKGLEGLSPDTEHILISLGDQPLITTDIIEEVLEKYLADEREMLVPRYQGQGGHPVIISREFLLHHLGDAEGPGGLRQLQGKYPEQIFFCPVAREEVVIDLDYFDEYRRYRKRQARQQGRWYLNYKFWLEGEGKLFGDGPCDILLRVDRYGSLKQAAEDISMSYSQAWHLLNGLEERLGFKLIEKRVGGSSGGGSELTPRGRQLLNDFLGFRKEIQGYIAELEQKYFSDWT